MPRRAVTGIPCAIVRAAEPYLTFARALAVFADGWRPAVGVHPQALVEAGAVVAADAIVGAFAFVAEGARIGARTVLHPHVSVGRFAEIGDDCVIHAQVSIRERVVLGNRVVLQDGVVIGGDGYGFARRRDGSHEKIPQIGRVVLEDDVEIGANTTIDRPAVGETRIGPARRSTSGPGRARRESGRTCCWRRRWASPAAVCRGPGHAGRPGRGAGHITIGKGTIATAQTGIPNSSSRRFHLRLSRHSQP